MGRKAMPDHLHLIRGNPGRRPRPRPVVIDPGMPAMPEGMSREAVLHWRRLATQYLAVGVLTPVDGIALQELAEAIAERDELLLDLREHGVTQEVVTTAGSVKEMARPQVAMLVEARRRVRTGLDAFGGRGAESRIRVKHTPKTKKARPGDEYFGT